MKKCAKCGIEMQDDEIYTMDGQEICDDCSIILSMQRTLKKCDPIAVHSAVTARKYSGQSGLDGLTDRQKKIYDYIKLNNGATLKQLAEQFEMPAEELDIALTVLRHMELCKGEKRENGVYMVPWEN